MPDAESHPVSEDKDRLTVTTGQPQATNRPASIQTGKVLSLSYPCTPDTSWSILVGPGGMQTEMEMKVTVDERQRTMEGFRSLGVIVSTLSFASAHSILYLDRRYS